MSPRTFQAAVMDINIVRPALGTESFRSTIPVSLIAVCKMGR